MSGLPVAPEDRRVDLFQPSFRNPTKVTNPRYPVSALSSVILLGKSQDETLRVEVTLLPVTRTIEWNGVKVENLVSQYVAYKNGRLAEVAIDWYAQDDAGAVWYFGEDVFNYENGVVKDTQGTWLTGRDGPAAMVMPANPKAGDVWRPENIPGKVFEEVTVQATGVTLPGPRGQVTRVLDTEQLYLDGKKEPKAFAPGYGEFSTGVPGQSVEAVALAVPVDAAAGPSPSVLTTGALASYDAAAAKNWAAASTALTGVDTAWREYQRNEVPPLLKEQFGTTLDKLRTAIGERDAAAAGYASPGCGPGRTGPRTAVPARRGDRPRPAGPAPAAVAGRRRGPGPGRRTR